MVEFFLVGDGRMLWKSGITKKNDRPKMVRALISGIERLVLRLEIPGIEARDRRFKPLAVWVGVKISRKEGTKN